MSCSSLSWRARSAAWDSQVEAVASAVRRAGVVGGHARTHDARESPGLQNYIDPALEGWQHVYYSRHLQRQNANAAFMSAIFWIETVQGPKGSFLQLQYVQTVLLNFQGLSWPHVSVGTLLKTF
jgi:hypothetical protein